MAAIWDSLGNLRAVVVDQFSATEIMEFSVVCRCVCSKGALRAYNGDDFMVLKDRKAVQVDHS